MATKKNLRRLRIKRGIRKKIFGTSDKPRLSIYKSNCHIYAQIIDDNKGLTIISSSSIAEKMDKGNTIPKAKDIGKILASKASEKGIKKVIFDRNGNLYHGRVKALAEGAREGGLEF